MDPPAALVGLWTAACPVLEAPSNHNDDSQPPPSSPGSRGFQCGEDGNAILHKGARPVARRRAQETWANPFNAGVLAISKGPTILPYSVNQPACQYSLFTRRPSTV
jgi:hypothetical protein